jgi:hypothetical protein
MSKVGIYLHGQLMISYPNHIGAYGDILEDLKEAIEQTGMLHELKLIVDEPLQEEYEEGSGIYTGENTQDAH